MKKKQVIIGTCLLLLLTTATAVGYFLAWYRASGHDLRSAIITKSETTELPLLEYSFPALRQKTYPARSIQIQKELETKNQDVASYLFEAKLLDRNMSGQLLIPQTVTSETPVIVLLRGYVPPESYETGVGTRNAAFAFAQAGFITLSPDFFGYGTSDPEPTDSWQARFEKPAAVIELIESIRTTGVPTRPDATALDLHRTNKIGIWGHSNGGQIALSTKVIMREPLPTTLWAPVTAPFPYSVLYFSDETADEGRGVRLWINQLDQDYDVRQFSFTQYLDGLTGPLQIQHGTNDDAALKYWSDEFIVKVESENAHREEVLKTAISETATESGAASLPLPPTTVEYFVYPGADHNLQPANNWSQAVSRDLAFFKKTLQFETPIEPQEE